MIGREVDIHPDRQQNRCRYDERDLDRAIHCGLTGLLGSSKKRGPSARLATCHLIYSPFPSILNRHDPLSFNVREPLINSC